LGLFSHTPIQGLGASNNSVCSMARNISFYGVKVPMLSVI
jgi:hypothetical protein